VLQAAATAAAGSVRVVLGHGIQQATKPRVLLLLLVLVQH
jgi:hypothetical protein